jgi:N-acetylmuramoyl-L-alanine amidase
VKRLCLIAAAGAALAAPALARAGDVVMRVVPLDGRAPAAAGAPAHFNMLAFKWAGGGAVTFRARVARGRWSDWQPADGDPTWTGAAVAFQVRRHGAVRDLRAYELWSRVDAQPVRALAGAGEPAIVTRSGWNADEEIVRGKPIVAPRLKLAVVHHTANSNDYTRAEAAAIVRGIEDYHVQGNGWNDIGYNFLVDRFGDVFEGRAGGMTRNVIGAHAEGFNSGTVGVALIGNFQNATPSKAMQDALVKLLAWRLDLAHVDPLSTVAYTSGGNAKFAAGKVVTLRAISGHRDTGPTDCPGNDAYAILSTVAKQVAATGLPKIYAPTVIGALGGKIRFQARLSAAAPWTVAVTNGTGATVAQGSGRGATVDWTWASAKAPKGSYAWTIAAPGALRANGSLGASTPPPPPPPVALSLTDLANDPATITPNADGSTPPARLSFTLSAVAQVQAQLVDESGVVVTTILGARAGAGTNSVPWDPSQVPAGRYRLVLTATPVGGTAGVTKWIDVVVDRTVGGFAASPSVFSPNGDGVDDTTMFSLTLFAPASVELDVERDGAIAATVFSGTLPAGTVAVSWDGAGFGKLLADGDYRAVVKVTDALGLVRVTIPLAIRSQPPVPPG